MHPYVEKHGADALSAYLIDMAAETNDLGFISIYREIARLSVDAGALNEENFRKSIEYIYTRADCFDFVLPGFLYIWGRLSDKLPQKLKEECKTMILSCKYWIDEGGFEKNPCYFTENHQILFHSNEYVAGELFGDEIFTNNGKTGEWHKQHARELILNWLEWRLRFGYSEWLSNCYYHEDLLALMNLYTFTQEKELKKRVYEVIILTFYDMALNSFKGTMGCSHGRAYCSHICNIPDNTTPMRALFMNNGSTPVNFSSATVLMAAEKLSLPPILTDIANSEETQESKQRVSINPEDGKGMGADPAEPKNVFLYWGMEAFAHRNVVDNTLKVKAVDNYYLMNRASAIKEQFELCDAAVVPMYDDADYTSMPQADIYTYKTRDYMLSCAQSFKPGRFGFQQHIWQATLDGKALIFTNHPGTNEYIERPNRFAGNRILPKAVAWRNVLICMYNTPIHMVPTFTYNTHAYIPQEFMDETVERGGWVFVRRLEAYAAIRAISGATSWIDPDPAFFPYMGIAPDSKIKPYEYQAEGRSNVWVLELGSKSESGSFEQFIEAIEKAECKGNVFDMTYDSPTAGVIHTGFTKPFTVDGKEITIKDYPRYDNAYTNAPAGAYEISIQHNGKTLNLGGWTN